MPGWRGPELCARVVGLAASDPGGAFAWLDGGDERGWLGLEADLSVEADSLGAIGAIGAEKILSQSLHHAPLGRVCILCFIN